MNYFCKNYIHLSFDVLDIFGECKYYLKGRTYYLEDIIPDGQCIHLLHGIHPYFLTLQNKGWFTWERDKNRVVARCIDGGATAEIRRYPKGKDCEVSCKIIGRENDSCVYIKGNDFLLNRASFPNLCFKFLDVIMPYAFYFDEKDLREKSFVLTCQNSDNFITIRI